tara:strand:+ start:392 stop:700 length:309 start_codon:yes stop_codon:yes gene_type:complete
VRLKRNIRRTVLILAVGVVASAATAQQSNPYGERNRLIALKEITWSKAAAGRDTVKLPLPAREHLWDHLGSVSSVNFSPAARIAVTCSWKEGRAYDIVTGIH